MKYTYFVCYAKSGNVRGHLTVQVDKEVIDADSFTELQNTVRKDTECREDEPLVIQNFILLRGYDYT